MWLYVTAIKIGLGGYDKRLLVMWKKEWDVHRIPNTHAKREHYVLFLGAGGNPARPASIGFMGGGALLCVVALNGASGGISGVAAAVAFGFEPEAPADAVVEVGSGSGDEDDPVVGFWSLVAEFSAAEDAAGAADVEAEAAVAVVLEVMAAGV